MIAAAPGVVTARTAAVVLGALAAFAVDARPVSVPDDRGATLVLDAPAARIVTLAPHLTELAYAAGAGARLVGVAAHSDHPPAARSLPTIGDASRVDVERVLALRPDLVLAWRSGNAAADIARLERLGLAVYVSEAERLPDVARALRALGRLAGTAEVASAAAADYERDVAALRARHAGRPGVRVFYEIWHRPLMTVNGRHVISDVLAVCGGINVFASAPLLAPAVSVEALLAARPEAILGGSSRGGPVEFAAQWRAQIAPLARVPARYVDPDLMQRATPRLAQGAAAVCEALEAVRQSGGGR